jgi:hypothetical protein
MEKVQLKVTTPVTFALTIRAMKGERVLMSSGTDATFELPQVFTQTTVSVELRPAALAFTIGATSVELRSATLAFTITATDGTGTVLETFEFERDYQYPEGTDDIKVSVIKRIPE